jgi:hypothetical protein
VPGPSVDLLAQLRPSEVKVNVAGHPFVLQATSASQWLGALAVDLDDLCGVMPGLICDDDLELMYEIMQTHADHGERWRNAARTALGRAAGRDWWWALNLSRKALQSWMYVNGILLRQNVSASQIGFPDWLDACYTMLWQNATEEDRLKLDLSLSVRPAGIGVRQSSAAIRKMSLDFAAD